jgi:predicted PurR-regulated permease PerM
LFIGAAVWGVAGMILFLPFAAMLKVVCEEFEELKPIALIIGEKNIKESNDFEQSLSRWWGKIKKRFSK